jgi:hypothetical protein
VADLVLVRLLATPSEIMGYYIRVLSTSADCFPVRKLESALQKARVMATLAVQAGTPDDWTQVILSHADGREIASIERNPVRDGSLGSEELQEFTDEIADCKPATAVRWLLDYFPRVRCIYAFQLLSGTDYKNGWDILGGVKNRIWSFAPSILQADAEGFSNEDGYHILWQFNDSVDSAWSMGVLRGGKWIHFQMDLGSRKHREAFFRGDVPDGVTIAI